MKYSRKYSFRGNSRGQMVVRIRQAPSIGAHATQRERLVQWYLERGA